MKNAWILGLMAGILVAGAAAAAQEAETRLKPKKQAKVYQAVLDEMGGVPSADVIQQIEGWKFEVIVAWEAQDPDAKEVAKHNWAKIKFSKKEMADVFGVGGAFKVVVFRKLIGTDRTTLPGGPVGGGFGASSTRGMTAGKDFAIDTNKYTVIRVVFRDDALFHVRVWPAMEQSGMSGGIMWRQSGSGAPD